MSRIYTLKHLFILAIPCLFLGFGATFYWLSWYFNPDRPEMRVQMFDRSVEINLCLLIEQDLEQFKESPLTFVRADMDALVAEAAEIAWAEVVGASEDQRYSKSKIDYLRDCRSEAKRWVKIRSLTSSRFASDLEYFLAEERALLHKSLQGPETDALASQSKPSTSARALVIGNAQYRDRPLRNPANDANRMSEKLRALGFQVQIVLNADTAQLKEVSKNFIDSMSDYEVNLFYYSGHGVEIFGRNFLLPSDAEIRRLGELARQGTDLTKLVADSEVHSNTVRIFIIDACRSLPVFSQTKEMKSGMKEIQLSGASGTLVAFSTAPGSVALDGKGDLSPYTSALIKQLDDKNFDIESLFKKVGLEVREATSGRQVPWYSSSIVGEIKLVDKK